MMVIVGDININILQPSNISMAYENLLFTHGFHRTINNYTREEYVNLDLKQSCIDHIYFRCVNVDMHTAVVEVKISDHNIVCGTIPVYVDRGRTIQNGQTRTNTDRALLRPII